VTTATLPVSLFMGYLSFWFGEARNVSINLDYVR
jgi:hypothetical protein